MIGKAACRATLALLHRLHHALAAWTFERIAAPDLKDEIAPKGAHESGTAPHGAAGRLG